MNILEVIHEPRKNVFRKKCFAIVPGWVVSPAT
jgi:hypothetical protein